MLRRVLTACAFAALTLSAAADTYQKPEAFLDEVFAGDVPNPQVVWLTGEVRERASHILGHEPRQLRIRYWQREARTVWIVEEIGKSEPITTGLVIDDGRIERVKVLIFRESRGWEVRHPFFTEQFDGARLTDDTRLSKPIDGISGATLSVSALKRLARLTLYLHRQVTTDDAA